MASLISVGQVVDQTFHHYQKYFKQLLGVSLYIFTGTPFFIAATVLYSATDSTRLILSAICTVLSTLVSIIAVLWASDALILSVEAQAQAKKNKTETITRLAWRKFLPFLAVKILIVLVLIGGAIVCLIPATTLFLLSISMQSNSFLSLLAGILFTIVGLVAALVYCTWIWVLTLSTPYALLLENINIKKSFYRTYSLVRGRWWAVLARIILPNLSIAIIVPVATKIIHFLLKLLAIGSSDMLIPLYIISHLADVALVALTIPFLVIANYYVFQSLVDTYKPNAS